MSSNIELKIAVIGETGCGKSTLINTLLGKIVLPESPMTSTPLITYIVYSSKEKDYAEIIGNQQNIIETLEIEMFIKKYCFNVKEQSDVERQRFLNVSHAVLYIRADFLRNGVHIIDTLGFSASAHDTEVTEAVLSSNINLIFYIVSKNMLNEFEIERIQNLLGYRTDNQIENGVEPIQRKTSLSKLYFICNEKDGIVSKGLQNSICRIFNSDDCTKSVTQINNFSNSHILKCNFLVARTKSCGIYPYSKYFSLSPTKEETEFSIEMERRQKRCLQLDDNDVDVELWRKTRKAINKIIDKKKKDIGTQKNNKFLISYRNWKNDPAEEPSKEFKNY